MCLCEGSDVFFVFGRGGMPCLPEANSDDETQTQTHYIQYAADGGATVKTLSHTQTLPL